MSLEEAQEMFGVEYAKEVGQYTEITPNFEWWFASGPYRGAQDVERRFHVGMEQVEKLMAWTDNHPEEVIWIAPDGTPGIEIGFDIELDGLRIRGFIDAVIKMPGFAGDNDDGSPEPYLVVRDYKTGNTPGDDFQLGVYGLALAETFGVEQPWLGDYYMAGKAGKPGRPTYPYQIGEWTRERVADKFRELEENIAAERFDPKPDPKVCNFCSVALSCEYSMA
jgi:putative RecB family exonuclease